MKPDRMMNLINLNNPEVYETKRIDAAKIGDPKGMEESVNHSNGGAYNRIQYSFLFIMCDHYRNDG